MTKPTLGQVLATAEQCELEGNYQGACNLYEAILRANPDDQRAESSLHRLSDPAFKTDDPLLRQEMRALLEAQKNDRAEATVKSASKLVAAIPTSFFLWTVLGIANKKTGRLEEAQRAFEMAIELNVDDPDLFNIMGGTLLERGSVHEATQCYRRAIQIRPGEARVHFNLGNALKRAGQYDEAVKSYLEAIRLDPEYAIAYGNLGNMLRQQGRLNDAVENLQKALELNPHSAQLLNNLGATLIDIGRFDEAIASFQRATKIDRAFVDAWVNICILFEKANDDEGMEEAFQQMGDTLVKQDARLRARYELLRSRNRTTSDSVDAND